jgi:hypothetical protein
MDHKEFYSNNFSVISKNINRLIIFDIFFLLFSYIMLFELQINRYVYFCTFVVFSMFNLSFMHHIKNFAYVYEYILRNNKTV